MLDHNWKLYSCWLGECSSSFQNMKWYYLLCFVVVVLTEATLLKFVFLLLHHPIGSSFALLTTVQGFLFMYETLTLQRKVFDGKQPGHVFRSCTSVFRLILAGSVFGMCRHAQVFQMWARSVRGQGTMCALVRKSNKMNWNFEFVKASSKWQNWRAGRPAKAEQKEGLTRASKQAS